MRFGQSTAVPRFEEESRKNEKTQKAVHEFEIIDKTTAYRKPSQRRPRREPMRSTLSYKYFLSVLLDQNSIHQRPILSCRIQNVLLKS